MLVYLPICGFFDVTRSSIFCGLSDFQRRDVLEGGNTGHEVAHQCVVGKQVMDSVAIATSG